MLGRHHKAKLFEPAPTPTLFTLDIASIDKNNIKNILFGFKAILEYRVWLGLDCSF